MRTTDYENKALRNHDNKLLLTAIARRLQESPDGKAAARRRRQMERDAAKRGAK